MRALFSYGVAFLILVLAGVWLASGHLVIGGSGPGQGERLVSDVLSGTQTESSNPELATQSSEVSTAAQTAQAEADRLAAEAATIERELNAAETEARKAELTEELHEKELEAEEAQKVAAEAEKQAQDLRTAANAVDEQRQTVRQELDSTMTIAERNAALSDTSTSLQSVRVVNYTAKPMPIEVPLRGRTEAKAAVSAVAETSGIIETVNVTKGQKVEAGDLLCTLDRGTRQAAVAQAEAGLAQANASLTQAQLDFDTNASLREKGLAASNTSRPLEVALTAAQAAVSASQAAIDNAKAELDRTDIVAKVGGVVQDPLASAGAMLAMGQPCATIVQLDPMLFVGQVPEARIGLAKLGLPASIKTVTGQTIEGKVSFISSTADPATRSFPVEIELPNADGAVLDGITAEATVNVGTAPAHLLPQSVLTLNDDGVLGIRAVEGDTAKFYSVQIASDTREGVWVLGLPASIDIITVGQEFVNDGQRVAATKVEEGTV